MRAAVESSVSDIYMSANPSAAAPKRKSTSLPIESIKKPRIEGEEPIVLLTAVPNSSSEARMSSPPPNLMLRKKVTSSPQTARKLVIKEFKVKPQVPENFERETWSRLKEAINAIHNERTISYSLEELYQAAAALCTQKTAATLYFNLQQECQSHIQKEGAKLLGQTSDNISFLNLVDTCWQSHCRQMDLIRAIFLVLDRTYVIQNSTIRSIWDMGLALFRECVMSIQEVEKKTLSGILDLIERDRNSETVNRTLLKSLLRMYSALGIYNERFEAPFLEATTTYYANEGIRKIQEYEVSEYLKRVEVRLQEENERIYHYLDSTTKKSLVAIVEKQLLETHISSVLEKGFDAMVEGNRYQELALMYHLFARVNGQEALKNSWKSYIKSAGTAIVNDPERDKNMVQDLLDFKSKLDFILEESFHRNEACTYALKEAFEYFINVRQNKPAELIAKFIDEKLKSGKGTTEEELENLLDKLMTLFRYIQGKDVFEAFYKKDLAKRLLLSKSASLDAEKSMIAKLKTECGSNFTNKLEGMFKDIDSSKELMVRFKESKFVEKLSHLPTIELNVYVLTTGNWPAFTPIECKLPSEMLEYQEVFKMFYLSQRGGRRLMWQNSLGHCTVRCNFPSGKKELYSSLFQAVILLLFNESEELSFAAIQTATGLEEKELKRTLQSLACGKVKILQKKPKGRDVNNDDLFAFNKDFSAKTFRIKVNSTQMKETVEENQKTNEGIIQEIGRAHV